MIQNISCHNRTAGLCDYQDTDERNPNICLYLMFDVVSGRHMSRLRMQRKTRCNSGCSSGTMQGSLCGGRYTQNGMFSLVNMHINTHTHTNSIHTVVQTHSCECTACIRVEKQYNTHTVLNANANYRMVHTKDEHQQAVCLCVYLQL